MTFIVSATASGNASRRSERAIRRSNPGTRPLPRGTARGVSAITATPTGIGTESSATSFQPAATNSATKRKVKTVFATSKSVTVPSRSSTESGIIIVACVFTSSTPSPPSTVPQNICRS